MPLLADYAITPDVFDVTSYSSEEVCGLHLETIRAVVLTEGLVRDLRDGEWRGLFAIGERAWHRRGKELVKKLATQGRLVRFKAALPDPPADDRGWCAEALGTHHERAFTGGVIVTDSVKDAYPKKTLVARIDRLGSAPWWTGRSSSATLGRSLADYAAHLDAVLCCSNSILFVDPHLDPARPGYRDFSALLARAGGRTPAPKIEVHRVCYEGSGPSRRFPARENSTYFERRFRDELTGPLRAVGLQAEVVHLGRLP